MIQDTTLITPSPTSEQARDRSLNLEHTVEENGDCSCCNDVRHVHDYLEYTLTLYLNLDVCEPGSKNKCEKDLRYEVYQPQNNCYSKCLPELTSGLCKHIIGKVTESYACCHISTILS